MSANSTRRLFYVWLALVCITLISWWIGSKHGHRGFRSDTSITAGVIAIAAIKVRVIMREFMEIEHAPLLWRRLTDGWLALLVVILLGIYALRLSIAPTI
jgi:hypothetical protein